MSLMYRWLIAVLGIFLYTTCAIHHSCTGDWLQCLAYSYILHVQYITHVQVIDCRTRHIRIYHMYNTWLMCRWLIAVLGIFLYTTCAMHHSYTGCWLQYLSYSYIAYQEKNPVGGYCMKQMKESCNNCTSEESATMCTQSECKLVVTANRNFVWRRT